MAYKPTWVANSFLNRARSEGVNDMDQLKVQKLVYCLHGWFLATQGTPAVGEYYEAWPYGPVLSSLYQEFKKAGRGTIDWYAVDIDPRTGDNKSLMVNVSDELFASVFNPVWERYKNFTGLHLSALTHAPGTPWSNARARGEDYLSNDEIRNHFITLGQTA